MQSTKQAIKQTKKHEHSSCSSDTTSCSSDDHHDGDYKKRCYDEKTCKRTEPHCEVKRKDGKTRCERRCYTVCEVRCEKPCAKKTTWSYKEKFEGEWECYEDKHSDPCCDDSSRDHHDRKVEKKKLIQKK